MNRSGSTSPAESGGPPRSLRDDVCQRLSSIRARTDWRSVRAPRHVEAWTLSTLDLAYPWVRCRIRLACPAQELMAFLVEDITDTLPNWSRDIETCEEIERLADDERILLIRTRGPFWPIAAREDLFYVLRGQLGDGGFFEASRAIERAEPVPAPGAVRSTMHFAYKYIQPSAGGCCYDVGWQYDPMGLMSRILPRRIVVRAVHDHLRDECRRLLAKYGCDINVAPPRTDT